MRFKILVTDGRARLGQISLLHGEVTTPVFLPVATRGSVRCISSEDLVELGYEMILANAYHLSLRPGTKVIVDAGGLHKFMNWQKPILTDSGGFQVFSLEDTKVEEEGVVFRSIYDGSWHKITPEQVVEIQERLGSDIIMPLDQPVPNPAARSLVVEAVERTTKWAKIAKERLKNPYQSIFGIVQGATFMDLRKRSVEELMEIEFPGYALGGFCLGESKEEMKELVAYTAGLLPDERPRYLMGIGTPLEIISAVKVGCDIFDCALPTHIARNGAVLTSQGKITIRNGAYASDTSPLDPECHCFVCQNYQRAYLRHLFQTKELTALYLATYHNLYFIQNLMRRIQEAIKEGYLERFQKEFCEKWYSVL